MWRGPCGAGALASCHAEHSEASLLPFKSPGPSDAPPVSGRVHEDLVIYHIENGAAEAKLCGICGGLGHTEVRSLEPVEQNRQRPRSSVWTEHQVRTSEVVSSNLTGATPLQIPRRARDFGSGLPLGFAFAHAR